MNLGALGIFGKGTRRIRDYCGDSVKFLKFPKCPQFKSIDPKSIGYIPPKYYTRSN